jgi:hypothetical protein
MAAQTQAGLDAEDQKYRTAVGSLVSEVLSAFKFGGFRNEKQLSGIANQLRDIAESYPTQTSAKDLTHIQVAHQALLSGIRDRKGGRLPAKLGEALAYEDVLIAMTPQRKRKHPH